MNHFQITPVPLTYGVLAGTGTSPALALQLPARPAAALDVPSWRNRRAAGSVGVPAADLARPSHDGSADHAGFGITAATGALSQGAKHTVHMDPMGSPPRGTPV